MTDDLAKQVTERLRTVVDPELGLNVVDLGLIYNVALQPDSRVLEVDMTLTTRGCPLEGFMIGGVKNALADIPGVSEIEVRLVWDPPWTPDRMHGPGQGRIKVH